MKRIILHSSRPDLLPPVPDINLRPAARNSHYRTGRTTTTINGVLINYFYLEYEGITEEEILKELNSIHNNMVKEEEYNRIKRNKARVPKQLKKILKDHYQDRDWEEAFKQARSLFEENNIDYELFGEPSTTLAAIVIDLTKSGLRWGKRDLRSFPNITISKDTYLIIRNAADYWNPISDHEGY
jgi:hypothetical protein